jgi:predicted HAD superfamily Cof-like phosphohydrolase
MSQTNFESVIEFNRAFGLPHNDEEQMDILVTNKQLSKLRVDLCTEEMRELNDAFKTKDFIEVIDALTDELYVLYGAASSFGFNMDAELRKYVNNSLYIDPLQTNYNFIRNMVVTQKVPIPDTICNNMFNEYFPPGPRNTYDQMNSVIKELDEHLAAQNYHDMKNSLVHMLLLTYKMGILLGIDLDKSFDIVHRSNMSKLCSDEQEAIDTVEWYKTQDSRYDSPTIRKADTGDYWIVFNKSTGKILKNYNYTPAGFECMTVA